MGFGEWGLGVGEGETGSLGLGEKEAEWMIGSGKGESGPGAGIEKRVESGAGLRIMGDKSGGEEMGLNRSAV